MSVVYYFRCPKEWVNKFDFYPPTDYGIVVGTCLSLTVNNDGSYYMQLSPTVEEHDCYADVDWRDLYFGADYNESTLFGLLAVVERDESMFDKSQDKNDCVMSKES